MIAAVFLASGRGKRFGGDKLLWPVEGVPMAERVFRALPPGIPGVVVTGSSEIAVLAHKYPCFTVVENRGGRDDVARTIRMGVKALPKEAEGALFFVCDQPWLERESVLRLAEAFQKDPDKIYVLSHGDRMGNPCLFPRKFFPELMALPPDTGGKAIIARHPERVCLVPAADARELADVDYRPKE